MTIELDAADLDVLIESLEYSKMNIREAPDTPDAVRRENLERVEGVQTKLRAARKNQSKKK